MEVYLLDSSFNTLCIIDKCITLEATKRFFSPGEFKMTLEGILPVDSAYALYEPVSKGCFVLERLEACGETVELSGRSLEALLEKRVLDGRGCYSGNAEKAVRLAFERNTSGDRSISGMILGDEIGLVGDGYFKTDYRSLSEFAYSTLRPFGATYRVELAGNTPVFKVVTGKDRTRAQTRYPPAVFSESMGMVSDGQLKIDLAEHKNTAYVVGGDGRSITVSSGTSPLDRREMFINGRDISPDEFNSDEEYFDALRSRGIETLSKHSGGIGYTGCSVYGLRYGADYSLGDICDVDTVSGLSLSERITSVKYNFRSGSVTLSPSFGELGVSLKELIKISADSVNING